MDSKTSQEADAIVTQQFFISEWILDSHNSTISEPLIIHDIRMQQLDHETLYNKGIFFQSLKTLQESCTAASTAKHRLRWCKTLGIPEKWMGVTASHFENRIMKTLEGALRVKYKCTVATSPWPNGMCEQMMREVVRALKAFLQERRDIREWVSVVPAVQWVLNTACRERYASTPYHVMFGRASLTSFLTLASSTGED